MDLLGIKVGDFQKCLLPEKLLGLGLWLEEGRRNKKLIA